MIVSFQKRPSFVASICTVRGASPTYWPLTSILAPLGSETIWTLSLCLSTCVCDAHPEQSSKTEAIKEAGMAGKSGWARCMRVALSEMGVVRLALCAFGYIVWQGERFWESEAPPEPVDAYTPVRTECLDREHRLHPFGYIVYTLPGE
jgi:hypothetical protein